MVAPGPVTLKRIQGKLRCKLLITEILVFKTNGIKILQMSSSHNPFVSKILELRYRGVGVPNCRQKADRHRAAATG